MKVTISLMLCIVMSCTPPAKSNVIALNLSNRNLSAIPDSVFHLTELQYLQLGNSFTLYPPLSALGDDKVAGDNLNKITKLPGDIEKLRQLKVLGLCFNDLRSLPKEMVKLANLDSLDLSFNEHLSIAKALETLKEMPWLKYLNIVATSGDQSTIDKLRKALPKTKIEAQFEDLESETVKPFE